MNHGDRVWLIIIQSLAVSAPIAVLWYGLVSRGPLSAEPILTAGTAVSSILAIFVTLSQLKQRKQIAGRRPTRRSPPLNAETILHLILPPEKCDDQVNTLDELYSKKRASGRKARRHMVLESSPRPGLVPALPRPHESGNRQARLLVLTPVRSRKRRGSAGESGQPSNIRRLATATPEATMKLTVFEALVLTGVVAAGTGAYAVPIFEEVEQLLPAKKKLSLGKMYVTLDHLEQSGLLRSWYSRPEEEPNGRSRRYFEITGAGSSTLSETLATSIGTVAAIEEFA